MNNSNRGGIGFIDALQLVLIVLKLLNLISWSWPVVLIPLWFDIALFFIIINLR